MIVPLLLRVKRIPWNPAPTGWIKRVAISSMRAMISSRPSTSGLASRRNRQQVIKAVFQRMGAEAWGHSVADLLVKADLMFDGLQSDPLSLPLAGR